MRLLIKCGFYTRLYGRRRTSPLLSYHHDHSFALSSELRRHWLVAIYRDKGTNFRMTKSTVLCSEHFLLKYFHFSARAPARVCELSHHRLLQTEEGQSLLQSRCSCTAISVVSFHPQVSVHREKCQSFRGKLVYLTIKRVSIKTKKNKIMAHAYTWNSSCILKALFVKRTNNRKRMSCHLRFSWKSGDVVRWPRGLAVRCSFTKNGLIIDWSAKTTRSRCLFCPVSGSFYGFIAWVVRTVTIRGQKHAKCTEMQHVLKHAAGKKMAHANTRGVFSVILVCGSKSNHGPCTQAWSSATCFVLNHIQLNLSNHCILCACFFGVCACVHVCVSACLFMLVCAHNFL